MSNLALVTDNMLPVANETFIDNLSAGISAGAAIVPINSLAEYSDGDSVVLTVDPGTASQATFIGEKQGNTVIDCKWTEGNVGASHAAGATVIDYDSATHYNVVTKLLRMFANENGSLKTSAVQAALNISSAVPADWTPLANVPSVTSNNGGREHVLTFTGVNYLDRLQKGSKLRIPRTGTTPTQSADFNGSSQYAVKTSPTNMTFTDDATLEAWINIDKYGSIQTIASRYNGTSGFRLIIDADGTPMLMYHNGGASNWTRVMAFQSIPIGRDVHIAARHDASTFTATSSTSWIMIDGVDVPVTVARQGSNPTALVQAGNLEVGSENGGTDLLDGRVSELRIWSGVRTQQQIRDNMNIELVGNESGLNAYYKLNGNFNDSTANANNLVSNGGVVATYNWHAFSAIEYAIVTKVELSGSDTLATVFTGQGTIPQATLSAVSYSNIRVPYGFPADKSQWTVVYAKFSSSIQSSPAQLTWYNVGSVKIPVPTGEWIANYNALYSLSTTAINEVTITLSTSPIAETNVNATWAAGSGLTSGGNYPAIMPYVPINNSVATPHYLNAKFYGGTASNITQYKLMPLFITAECAYV